MNEGELTDEALAALAAREGSDGPAFCQLVTRFEDRIWRMCYRLVGNEHDAADAMQEVCVRMFTARSQFAARSSYATWVYGIAVNVCLALRRGRGRRNRRLGSIDQAALESVAEAQSNESANAMDVDAILETLSEQDRAMVILKYVEEYSYADLAEIFQLSESACKMRVSRAKDKLQELFPNEKFPLYEM